jgi:hypothetical protein
MFTTDFWDLPEVQQHSDEFWSLVQPLDQSTKDKLNELNAKFHVFIFEEGRLYEI